MKEKKSIFSVLLDSRHRSRTISYTMVAVAYIILEVLLKTGNLSSLFTGLLVPATCYLVAAIGLNLNVGVSGELNLGQAGFCWESLRCSPRHIFPRIFPMSLFSVS